MSRGPGVWQRAILDAIERNPGGGVILTSVELTKSQQSAIRRAAEALRVAGDIQMTSERVGSVGRLVAYGPDVPLPPAHLTTGLDGKIYRRPR